MLKALAERERGTLAWTDGPAAAAASHRPHRFHSAALGDAGLGRRLQQTAALAGHSGGISALAWGEGGDLLASGGEDCRLRLWRAASGELLHSLDTGHTAAVLGTCFLPGRADQLLCCSADRQIRHLNVTKGAVRPYLVHSDRVRALVPLDTHLFLSASEDGTVREFDVRQRPAAVHRDALAGDDSNVLVDQRAERVGRTRVRVGIYSLAVDEQRPWLMLTGGADPLLRLYDRRMLVTAGGEEGGPSGGGRRAQQWVSCYVPSHLKAAVWDSGRHPALAAPSAPALPGRHVTAVAFARGGAEVVGSYAGEAIYSFDVAAHARDVEALLHIPDSVLRQPGRPRSHIGRRSMHAYASSQERYRSAGGRAGDAAAAATAEGGGGTAPASAGQVGAAAQAAAVAGQLQQRQRAAPGRGMAVAPSVHQLALQQRRQLSRIAAADAAEPPRAESSRPAHWQMHPTSSTLRSPLYEVRQLHATLRQRQQARVGADVAVQQEQQAEHEVGSDSEALSEGVGSEGQPAQQGVRRSRRIMRRRRDAAEQEHQQQQDAAAAAGAAEQAACAAAEQEVQQPAVSGVAEAAAGQHSCSDSEHADMASPAPRRRVRRRLGAGAAAAEHAAAQHQASDFGGAAAAAAEGSGGGGGFKAPAGRSPQQRRQAAAAAAAMHRLDSTVGLLHHHPLQQEASEVAARGAGHVQQEATVSQRQPAAVGARGLPERSLAMEVNSRPVLSASRVGLATQLGSQGAGHEASSLNSAEQPANERVGSVAQHGRADAPSVGNAPLATTAAAGGRPGAAGAATVEQVDQQQRQQQAVADGREASTGHWRPRASIERVVPPPPQFTSAAAQQQGQVAHGTRQRGHLQPTASTGTSRPVPGAQQQQQQQRHMLPAASGRLASRLRRHGEADGGAPAAAGAGALGSSQAAEAAAEIVDEQQQQQQPAGLPHGHAAPSLLQAQPQATMLSGRGPSVLGDFMPPEQDQPVDSAEIQQQQQQEQGGTAAGAAQRGGTQHQAQQAAAAGAPLAGRPPPRRRQVESNIGAIVLGEEAEGEEVSEPLMYRRCYAGHLNLSGLAGGDAVPLAPPLAFLGAHSELLVSPSDDGNLFLWHYASGSLAAVLTPPAAAQPTLSAAGSPGEVAELAAAAAATCVAAHPLLPVLASGGVDSVVRLWSPEAEEAACMQFAAAAAQANLQRLAAAGMQPPDGGGMLPAALQGRPLDCRAM